MVVLAETWHGALVDGALADLVPGPDLPFAVAEPAAVVDDVGRVVVIGGSGSSGAYSTAYSAWKAAGGSGVEPRRFRLRRPA